MTANLTPLIPPDIYEEAIEMKPLDLLYYQNIYDICMFMDRMV